MKETAKNLADIIRTATGKEKIHPLTTAIIVAAGNSTRMNCEQSKQFLAIDGMPVIAKTLRAFEQAEKIDDIIIVAKECDHEEILSLCQHYEIKKFYKITSGGETRQESVLCGFKKIKDKTKFVAIHDGARCLITTEDINRVCEYAYKYGAASASTPVSDTVKLISKSNFIDYDTQLDRNKVRLVQTPQVFGVNLYRAAAYTAKENNFTATDDNALVENIKYNVKLVDCRRDNIKITTSDDLILAKLYIDLYKEINNEDKLPFGIDEE
jgi:2-C-methyl-D-erythritol 4-phosphate cytidylyltransferase